MEYTPASIEPKWQQYWNEHQIYQTSNQSDKPKYYVLDMFPYPSGEGLHVGHPLGYVASDIFARYKRLSGFNVLHPMGYDAFGLPAEQYAIQTGIHPETSTRINTATYRAQLDKIGFCFDWSREINTSKPAYYRWTQTIFKHFFEHYYNLQTNRAEPIADLVADFAQNGNLHTQAHTSYKETFTAADWNAYTGAQKSDILMNYRLAYRKVGFVNWCEALGTVLANDEVKDGLSERGGHPVIKKPMMQWMLRISAYAERLLQGLDTVDFSDSIKTQQRNWIGKSQGARVFFNLPAHPDTQIEVFTTRPDTIFGAGFLVLAPEHELVAKICTDAQKSKIADYLAYTGARSERERATDVKHVTGAFTGAYALHPFTGQQIPIWVSEYVLVGYGTGAVMAVPAEDERDNRFAKHFQIPITEILDTSANPNAAIGDKVGVYINSDFLNGLEYEAALAKVLEAIETKNIGKKITNYKLHDSNFSRQRYWGEPFPIQYSPEGEVLTDTELPVVLPELHDFHPTADGRSPLAKVENWVNLPNQYTRETDTMPGYAGSSWYFLRYMDANNPDAPFSKQAVDYWQQVDLYVGGSEHAVGHLLYARFWNMFLYDLGLVPCAEPFKKLINQGMIQGIVESIYLQKERRDGKSVFKSADLVPKSELDNYTQIPVHINFVSDYGLPDSFLDLTNIEKFKAWRPAYEDAIFELNSHSHLVTHSEVGKMSKRWYNVVNPDEVIAQYGADCFRMYEMFLGPLEDAKPWNTKGIEGVYRFLVKFWGLYVARTGEWLPTAGTPSPAEQKVLHTCLKKVRQDLDGFNFNTTVAAFMIAVNDLRDLKTTNAEVLEKLAIAIAPFAPHLADELWSRFGHAGSIHKEASFPTYEEKYLVASEINYPVSINGKHRSNLIVPTSATQAEIEAQALALPETQKWTADKEIAKIIFVKNKMVNIVVK